MVKEKLIVVQKCFEIMPRRFFKLTKQGILIMPAKKRIHRICRSLRDSAQI